MKAILSKNNLFVLVLLIAIFLFQILLIKPFFHSGFFPTHDGVQTVRIFEYYQALKYGQLPPRWSSGLLYGHGYPLFVFYGPFSYILGSVFAFAGVNFMLATKLVFILGFFIGAIGIFFLIRQLAGNLAAFFSTFIYSLIPYRAVNVYVRGALAEFLAFSIFPWLLLINIKLIKAPKNNFLIILMGLLSSILIITHNLAALVYAVFLIPFNFFYTYKFERKNFLQVMLSCLISASIALLFSCFYWLPLVIESNFVSLSKFANYPYSQFFVTFQQLWQSTWDYGGFTEANPMSLQFGQAILVISLLTFIFNLIIKNKYRSLILFFSFSFVILTLLETQITLPVWDNITLIHYLQFPWRLHIITTIIGIILVGFFFYLLRSQTLLNELLRSKLRSIPSGKFFSKHSSSQQSCEVFCFKNNKTTSVSVFIIGVIVVLLSAKESFNFFKAKSFSDQSPVSETTTWNDEYMPIWVKSKPKDYDPEKVILMSKDHGKLENIEWGYSKKSFTLIDPKENRIKIAQVFYPGWEAFINNQKVFIDYDNPQGLMTIDTPVGKNEIVFKFAKTWWRWIADIISLSSFIAIFTFIFFSFLKTKKMLNVK